MIPSRHTRLHNWLISRFTRRGFRKHFDRVIVHGGFVEEGKSILVTANHFSWWDGFFIFYLNEKLFHRRFHVMMLEEQLRSNMILNKVGAFSVQKNSRSVVESLQYARNILSAGPQNLLLFYPQGEIQSLYASPLSFEKGLEKVVTGQEDQVAIWMVACLVDYFSHKKPELHLYLKPYTCKGGFRIRDYEEAYNRFLSESKNQQQPDS